MSRMKSARVHDLFAELTVPRRRKVFYPLINVVTIALCAVLCGADDLVSIVAKGRTKKQWLAKLLDLSSGVPSHDRFNAILAAIKPAEFEKCLLSCITALHEITDGQVVTIDGKTLRRRFDAASSKATIHMVSAWATANSISLGQVVTDEKSDEITPISKLLEMLKIKGCLVMIDAMGCQKEIARQIVAGGADYCLAANGNRPTILRPVEARGFVVLPKRWIVERTFAWLSRYRRHAKDYERNIETSEAMIYITMIILMSRRLARKNIF